MYRIKDWHKFQHFKDRRPPWIKLYRELIDDPEYHRLLGEAAKYLTLLWLLASEDNTKSGLLPSVEDMAFRLRLAPHRVTELLSSLSHYIIQDDINLISKEHQYDTPETETETEKRQRQKRDAIYLKHPLLKTLHDVPMLRGLTLEMWLKCVQNRHKFLNWPKAVKWVCDQAELEGNIKSPGKFVDTRLSYYEKDHLSECKQREEKASVRAKDLKEFIEYMSDKDIPQEHKTQNINDMKKQYGQDFINEAETEMLKK